MSRLLSLFLIFMSTAALAAEDLPRTITVSGFGSVETPPDRATLMLSIMTRGQTVEALQQETADVVAKVLALAEEMDIPDSRVDTMSSTIHPNYRYDQQRMTQELDGYMASRQMRIVVHDLEKVGELMERAVQTGVNQVMPPQLESSKSRDAYRDALERAVDDARLNAERLADSLGLELGDAIQITSTNSYQPPVMFGRAQMMAMESSAALAVPATYNAGDMTVSATVNVIFETGN